MRIPLTPGTIATGAVISIILLASASALRMSKFESRVLNSEKQSEARFANAESTLASLQEKVDALLFANQSVAIKLEEERVKRLAAESQRMTEAAQANQKISALQQEVTGSRAPNVSAIISQWRPLVASVKCHWDLPNGASAEDSGSGVLMSNDSYPTIITNRHVVVYLGVTAHHCAIQFPGETTVTVTFEPDIHPSPTGIDWATIELKTASQYVKSLATNIPPRCTSRASVGDSIIILGYPSIGSRDDVTATEGIISGYEDDYYISSAKVERGNSGGGAIATKQNCYLGAPTYVGAGQLETLARILDQAKIPQ